MMIISSDHGKNDIVHRPGKSVFRIAPGDVGGRGLHIVQRISHGDAHARLAEAERHGWRLDTSVPGNDNGGHEGKAYGTELAAADKDALVESVRNGRGGIMPAWAGRLDDTTIKALAVYVHSFGGGEN